MVEQNTGGAPALLVGFLLLGDLSWFGSSSPGDKDENEEGSGASVEDGAGTDFGLAKEVVVAVGELAADLDEDCGEEEERNGLDGPSHGLS